MCVCLRSVTTATSSFFSLCARMCMMADWKEVFTAFKRRTRTDTCLLRATLCSNDEEKKKANRAEKRVACLLCGLRAYSRVLNCVPAPSCFFPLCVPVVCVRVDDGTLLLLTVRLLFMGGLLGGWPGMHASVCTRISGATQHSLSSSEQGSTTAAMLPFIGAPPPPIRPPQKKIKRKDSERGISVQETSEKRSRKLCFVITTLALLSAASSCRCDLLRSFERRRRGGRG